MYISGDDLTMVSKSETSQVSTNSADCNKNETYMFINVKSTDQKPMLLILAIKNVTRNTINSN